MPSSLAMPSRLVRWALHRARKPPSDQEYGFSSLPPELLITVLDMLDDKSLHLMAAVSKRFYHLATRSLLLRYDISPKFDRVILTSSAALCALRIALTLSPGKPRIFSYLVRTPTSITKDLRRIEAVLARFSVGTARPQKIRLLFGEDLIRRQRPDWTIGSLTTKLLATICGSAVGLFVVGNGLFTCKPKGMLNWNPYAREPYVKMMMHDGSRQWVPTIRSIKALEVNHSICSTLPQQPPWTFVGVNIWAIHTLLLSIRLSAQEWDAILPAITLPVLRVVGIWAETISAQTSTAFLTRHHITALKYMSPCAEAAHTVPALVLPHLQHLTALSHYVVHIFGLCDASAPFPALTRVELFRDAHFHQALHRLSSHPTLSRLTLWGSAQIDLAPTAWPSFPHVEFLCLNHFDIGATHLPALIARAFPVVQRIGLNHSFPLKPGSTASQKSEIRTQKEALVDRIARENPAVQTFTIDNEFFPPP
ncbi:hypothetical protein K438DRAFT_1827351 [Mycena galopus ATCC 62051]|nr:hypothetical protein K438DRAFT_1827351 [Mycena galopus ATCC 62051]